jgi:hypothetical protein
MAEGKKSFILYLTQRPTFEGLTDEEAGKLIKTIFSYVSDENPQPTGIIKYAFEIIKPLLKADLKEWENIKQKRTEAGRLGGIARANNLKQNVANLANATNDKQAQANQAVNVNDNVNVNVNDNVNVNVVSKETNNNIYTVGNPPVEYIGLFDFWNSKPNLIHHKEINEARFKAFKKVLKIYSCDEIHKAIDRYSMILESDYRFTYKWSLEDFLNRKNGISNFMDEGSVWCSFQQAAKINPYLIPGKREERKPTNEMIKAFLSKVGEK